VRCIAAIHDLPNELSLNLVADPHAAIAVDAPRHIDMDVRMRIVYQRGILLAQKIVFGEPVLTSNSMEWFIGILKERPSRILPGEHLQIHPPCSYELGGLSLDLHARF
jgi:hypothetical protein